MLEYQVHQVVYEDNDWSGVAMQAYVLRLMFSQNEGQI